MEHNDTNRWQATRIASWLQQGRNYLFRAADVNEKGFLPGDPMRQLRALSAVFVTQFGSERRLQE